MSVATSTTEYDIFEFVSCAQCHLPFSADGIAPPPVPFWLTECGHIICNNHLTPDQSCVACGSKPVQMVPLQREMDPPLSDWFRTLPYSLDSLAQAAKFQQELLSTLVRYYKSKCIQQRNLLERIKGELNEVKGLKKQIQALSIENEQLRRSMEQAGGRSSFSLNSNGKRQRTDAYSAYSSPRSAATPVGPGRLTLPPDQQQGTFVNRASHSNSSGQSRDRLGSAHFAQQYTYTPAQPSHQQAPGIVAPQLIDSHSGRGRPSGSMLPPPTPQRFHTNPRTAVPQHNASGQSHRSRANNQSGYSEPVSRQVPQATPSRSFRFQPQANKQQHLTPATSTHFAAPSVPRASTGVPSVPQTPSGSRFVPANSRDRIDSRMLMRSSSTSTNQRTPFVPGARFG